MRALTVLSELIYPKTMANNAFFLHPPSSSGALDDVLLILWHGAGGDVDNAHIVSMVRAFNAAGAWAARARFPYRVEGRRAPDRMPKLIVAARDTIEAVREEITNPPNRLLLGGRSMGGRAASMLAAEGDPIDGLIYLSYPLHPARKPDKLRDAHLYDLDVPMLFLTGDKDALAQMELLEPIVAKLKNAEMEVWRGADHSFRKVDPAQVDAKAVDWAQRQNASR